VRRYARPDKFQLADRSVGRLLLLGGPVGCLVSASIGSTCLLLSGALSREQFLYSWGTWWVGDTIGVLVFTPLTLSWLAWRTQMPLRRRLAVAIPMAVSFGMVVLLYVYTSGRDEARLRVDFETKADGLYQTLVTRLEDQLVSLDAIERFITGSDNLTRKNFAHVVAPFLRRYTAVQGYSWDPAVSAEQRAAVETAARAEGFPKFEIREIGPDGQLARAGRRSWYVPVRYIEALERNARVLGFDVMSEVDRRSTLEAARDSGRTLATTPFPLLQRDKQVPGIIIYRPVYLRGVEPDTLEAKRRNIQGFVAGVFRVNPGEREQHV
jgi:CHASE1-domain containing sensor protein